MVVVSSLAAVAALGGSAHAISASQAVSANWLRAVNLTSMMTLEEKANITVGQGLVTRCSGVTGSVARLGVPELCFNDGPAGMKSDQTTVFPAEVNAASTWDTDLVYRQANAMGAEFRGKGVNVAFAPVTSGPLGRTPYMGRNWESYGSDPYLTGIHSYYGVKGIQDAGVIASPKHFVGYEQETYRFTGLLQGVVYGVNNITTPANNQNPVQISSDIGMRTLRELYLWPFEEMMAAKPLALMCSYNRLNGTSACADSFTLTQVLKGEWEFPGFVLSDYGAVLMAASTVATANAGLDMDLPGGEGFWGAGLVSAVQAGNVSQARVDDMVHRILYAYFEAKQDVTYPQVSYYALSPARTVNNVVVNEYVDVRADHHEIAREVAAASNVLLKNTGGLPLKKGARLSVFGSDASLRAGGLIQEGFDVSPPGKSNGTIAVGFGSGSGYFSYLVDPLAAINYEAISQRWSVYPVTEDYSNSTSTQKSYNQALARSDTAIVFVSVLSGEGYDRTNLRFDHDGDALIKYVADRCANTVVVAHIPAPTNFEVAALHPNVTAILNAGYPGQESGRALVDVLTGRVNPSGKLVYTILQNDADYIPVNRSYALDPRVAFSEELLYDYRAADARNLPVRYPFGHGLSYTSFTYGNISVRANALPASGRAAPIYTVSANLTNTGRLSGAEASQLYLSFPASAGEPARQLRGFTKTSLKAGESRRIQFSLRRKDLQIWSTAQNTWTTPAGQFEVKVGGSSRDLPLTATFTI